MFSNWTRAGAAAGILFSAAAMAPGSLANVAISTAQTQNMVCSAGVCTPTATNAVLNVTDLENLLAASNIEITTTGSGVQAGNIELDTPLTWSNSNMLSLDAYQSILIDQPATVSGAGGLSIATNDGGTGGYFGFGQNGQVIFSNLFSPLTINGAAYSLAGNIATLAGDISANPAGNYALANSYDAKEDGTYQNSAIPTEYSGSFEGLGNTISNLSLKGTGDINSPVGLFAELGSGNNLGGNIENISLINVDVKGNGFDAGGLVGVSGGMISGAFVSGSVESESRGGTYLGLLVGVSVGPVTRSGVVGKVSTNREGGVGGLCSACSAVQSYADVQVSAGKNSRVGGLTAGSDGALIACYAIGGVHGGVGSDVGGLVGENTQASTISQSYSTAYAKLSVGLPHGYRGGLIGLDNSPAGNNTSDYWDLDTSHVKHGAGKPKHDPGVTGLTTQQLQSGLPQGFDPTVWAEDPQINGGFPYLIANPPRN